MGLRLVPRRDVRGTLAQYDQELRGEGHEREDLYEAWGGGAWVLERVKISD